MFAWLKEKRNSFPFIWYAFSIHLKNQSISQFLWEINRNYFFSNSKRSKMFLFYLNLFEMKFNAKTWFLHFYHKKIVLTFPLHFNFTLLVLFSSKFQWSKTENVLERIDNRSVQLINEQRSTQDSESARNHSTAITMSPFASSHF